MKVFVMGATGYIGGSVAEVLVKKGYDVSGLVRSTEKAEYLKSRNIQSLTGDLSSEDVLSEAAKNADVIINAADADDRKPVETIFKAIGGTGKIYIQTSGSSIISDAAAGEASETVYDGETAFEPLAEKRPRVELDNFVRAAAKDNIRSIVICPTMVYGIGSGYNPHSIQIPFLINQAKKDEAARYIGAGANRWSNVHIDDLTDLYLLALERAQAGSFFFAENGEKSLKAIAEEIGGLLNVSAESWTEAEAIAAFGRDAAVFGFGSNSRVSSRKARELGWNPQKNDILGSIREEV
jgi:nucleoside-diphosphate-sugar epimerase